MPAVKVPSQLLWAEFQLALPNEAGPHAPVLGALAQLYQHPAIAELYGGRDTGKTRLFLALLRCNSHLKTVCIVTKGKLPAGLGCPVHWATDLPALLLMLNQLIADFPARPIQLLGIDTLGTLFDAAAGSPRDNEGAVKRRLLQLAALGVRVLLVNSTLHQAVPSGLPAPDGFFWFKPGNKRFSF